MRLNIETAKDGKDIFELITDEGSFFLNSRYRPEVEAEKFAKQYENMKEGDVLAVFGYGNGMFPKALWKMYGQKVQLIFLEPCAEIAENMKQSMRAFCEQNNVCISIPGGEQECDLIYSLEEFPQLLRERVHYGVDYQIHFCALPRYKELFPKEYAEFEENLRYRVSFLHANIYSAQVIGHLVISNNIRNLSYVVNSYSSDSYVNLFPESMPVVIVSAGPSLEKNVKKLKQARERMLILCVDAAVPYLLREGIYPHMVGCIDPRKGTELFEEASSLGILLIADSDVDTEVLRCMNHSPVIFAGTENPIIRNMYRLAGHELVMEFGGGSISTYLFQLSCKWGFKNIILVGQDLAMTGKKCYAGDERIEYSDYDWDWLEVEGIDGDTVITRRDYYLYLKWFEQNIALHPELNVIDATEGGAKIKGTQVMSLEEVVQSYGEKECNIEGILSSVQPAFDETQRRELVERITQSRNTIYGLIQKLEDTIALSARGIQVAKKEKMSQRKGLAMAGSNELFYKSLNQKIEALCSYYDTLDEMFLIDREIDATELDDYLRLQKEDNSQDLVTQYDWVRRYFGFLKRAAEKVVSVYDEMDVESGNNEAE